MKTTINLKDAFKIGYKGFFANRGEWDTPTEVTDIGAKEYTRGWQAAYAKNVEFNKEREARRKQWKRK